ncbi:MAG: hypothetical protein KGD64_03205 [Candidatus Heimdallarchaeota archaeon]|nr:hypothetical protein [Candidatus Heimdallarchaeota archaeon]
MTFSLNSDKKYILDTNFFISGFEKNPSDFNIFLKIVADMGVKLHVTNFILQEIRWYLRRRIKPPVKIEKVFIKDIRKYKENIGKNSSQSPQMNDLSNILAAKNVNGVVVSSDLQLVKFCELENVPVLISSSFVFLLKTTCENPNHEKLLEKIHDTILSDEIRHSVEKRQTYDPVTRIKKIQEHAINVLQNISETKNVISKKPSSDYHLLSEENNLIDLMNEIEFEFPNYLEQLKDGNLEGLYYELEEAYTALSDLSLELRIALVKQ